MCKCLYIISCDEHLCYDIFKNNNCMFHSNVLLSCLPSNRAVMCIKRLASDRECKRRGVSYSQSLSTNNSVGFNLFMVTSTGQKHAMENIQCCLRINVT